jgi:nucleoid DNA-binding protein
MFEQYISELLYKYDSVILPGFGAFVLKYVPTSIHPVENKLTPPSKIVSFDLSMKQNDGILANYISEKKRISFIEANNEIRDFVNKLNKTLSEEKQISFQKIGSFSRSDDSVLSFTPDLSANYNLETFGMGEIAYKPILRDDIKERLQKQFSENTRNLHEKKKFYKTTIWIVSAVVVAILAITIPFTNFDFIFKKSTKTEKPIIKETSLKKENKPIADTIKADTSSVSKKNQDQPAGKKYYIISGSFRVKENAENYVQTLKNKGYNPEVIFMQDKGMYAVSYNSYATPGDADMELSKIRTNDNPGAWILYH